MNVTIRNSKSSTTFNCLAVGDFFIFENNVYMKITCSTSGCKQGWARYFGNDSNESIVLISDWALVEPVKVVEIIVERPN